METVKSARIQNGKGEEGSNTKWRTGKRAPIQNGGRGIGHVYKMEQGEAHLITKWRTEKRAPIQNRGRGSGLDHKIKNWEEVSNTKWRTGKGLECKMEDGE